MAVYALAVRISHTIGADDGDSVTIVYINIGRLLVITSLVYVENGKG